MALVHFLLKFLVCKRKLESKKEALLILSKELDTCQQERDQYKLMANQLRERHQGLKKKYRELIVSGSAFKVVLFCDHPLAWSILQPWAKLIDSPLQDVEIHFHACGIFCHVNRIITLLNVADPDLILSLCIF